jgi:hypothetical protein
MCGEEERREEKQPSAADGSWSIEVESTAKVE